MSRLKCGRRWCLMPFTLPTRRAEPGNGNTNGGRHFIVRGATEGMPTVDKRTSRTLSAGLQARVRGEVRFERLQLPEFGVPVLARGAGTSLARQCCNVAGRVC